MNPFEEENNDTPIVFNTKITIWIESNGKKKNTFISGLPYDSALLKEHLKNIKKKNGCNGSIKDDVLQFQGDQIDNVEKYFNELGINDITINSSAS